jgi:hypothetical protein
LSDNILGTVTLNPLCARIPTRHDAIRVEHVDGIITDAIHEQVELPLGKLVFRSWPSEFATEHLDAEGDHESPRGVSENRRTI